MRSRLAVVSSVVVAVALAGCPRPGPTLPPAGAPAAAPPAPVEVAITVDDLPVHGPSPSDGNRGPLVERLLTAFRKHAVPRVYCFVNGGGTADGRPITDAPDADVVLRLWVGAGHPVGNHTWSHVNLLKTPLPDYFADLEKNEPLLERLMTTDARGEAQGLPWKMFRYPFLSQGDTQEKHDAVRAYLKEHGYQVAEVSIDGEDWAFNKPFARCTAQGDQQALAQLHKTFVSVHVDELRHMREVTRTLEGREVRHILLLHAGIAEADAIEDLLSAYEREGVRWIDLPAALADVFYAHDPAYPAKFGASFPYLVARSRKVRIPPSVVLRDLAGKLEKMCPDPAPPAAAFR